MVLKATGVWICCFLILAKMQIIIKKINPNIDAGELEELLKQLPPWRRKKALFYRYELDQYLCVVSFFLLQKMLDEGYGLKSIPEFTYKKKGKPYFKEYPYFYFNISHCRTGIACAVDDKPVGIDIEEISYNRELAEYVLSPQEFSIVQSSSCPGKEFIKFWTMKESYLKLTGEGITRDLQNVLSSAKGVEFKTFVGETFITTVAMSNVGK